MSQRVSVEVQKAKEKRNVKTIETRVKRLLPLFFFLLVFVVIVILISMENDNDESEKNGKTKDAKNRPIN